MICLKSFILILSLFSLNQLAFTAYNPTDAVEYASASALAYCPSEMIESWNCGAPCVNLTGYQYYYTNIFDVAYQETLSFSMIYNPTSQRFITSFRGTVGSIELLLEVAEGGALAYNLSSLPDAFADNYFYKHYRDYLRDSFLENLRKAYASFPTFTFVFTGHSLGATFTTLAAYDSITEGIIPSQQSVIYNYGSPRVGNQIFADAVQSVVPEIYRVVHWKDMVVHVPPCIVDIRGNCVPTGLDADPTVLPLTWHAWHLQPQIFYNQENTEYTVCGAEEASCADQFSLAGSNTGDHHYYVGISMSCDGISAFPMTSDSESDGEEVLTKEQLDLIC